MVYERGRQWQKSTEVEVVVRRDTSGMDMENRMRRGGGNAVRGPDGCKAFAALRKIVQDSYEKTHAMAVAHDGPLGPRHEPKKLAFYLSEHAEEDFVGISLSYSSCLRLKHRWDKYVIPLPYTTVTVAVKNYGVVKKSRIPELPTAASETVYTEKEKREGETSWRLTIY